MGEFGYELPDRLLLGDDLLAVEPSLSPQVKAGFLISQHWHVRPESFNEGVAAAARRLGVEIREGAEVVDFIVEGRRLRGARTAAGDIEADQVIVAAGSWTPRLLADLGVGVPMRGRQGLQLHRRADRRPRPRDPARRRPRRLHPVRRTDADRRHDGVQRRQPPPRPAPDRRHRSRAPAPRSAAGRGPRSSRSGRDYGRSPPTACR